MFWSISCFRVQIVQKTNGTSNVHFLTASFPRSNSICPQHNMFNNGNGEMDHKLGPSTLYWCKNRTKNNFIWTLRLSRRPSLNQNKFELQQYTCHNGRREWTYRLRWKIFGLLLAGSTVIWRSVKHKCARMRLEKHPTLLQRTANGLSSYRWYIQ